MCRAHETSKQTRTELHNTLALPALLYGSENWTIKARDARGITAAEMKYVRITAGYTWTDYTTNTKCAKETKYSPSFGQDTGIQKKLVATNKQTNRMSHNRLPRILKNYRPAGRRNRGDR